MPPHRTSRPRSIPENLIVNWRPSDFRDGAKPLLRRPATACDACRNAKARCNGKQGCERCIARGLVCTYTTQVAPNRGPPRGDSAQSLPTPATRPMQSTTQGVPAIVPAIVPAGSTAAGSSPTSTNYQPSAALESIAPAGWADDLQHQSIHPFNSSLLDIPLADQAYMSTAHSASLGNDTSQCLADAMSRTSPQRGHDSPCRDNTQGASSATSEPPISFGFHNHQVASHNCLCRPSLMLCLPKVTDAMQAKRLDEIFKVTGELIRRCQDVMDCQTKQVNCTNLLLVVTALQEIQPCFDYIAKSDLDSAVKVSFGGYEASLRDMNLRAMLVMDLVKKTETLLTSISSTGQGMINQLSEPSCLASANIAYLEAMISHFRTILRCVTIYMEEAVNNGGPVSVIPLNEFASASATT